MRLLKLDDSVDVQFVEPFGDSLPEYGILSHTWGPDETELTFDDVRNGTGRDKAGYAKVQFCGQQARMHDLHYFWVDTCCINKEKDSELSHAIKSMFRWYRRSARCYVYLSDVWISGNEALQRSWDSDLYKSKWFTRGWTLQELLVPGSVEFFSQNRLRIGDKSSLEGDISGITGIPTSVLQGRPLSSFSREERLQWSSTRKTGRPEDKAYSLLGIFDIEMPIAYGEGAGSAIRRLGKTLDRRDKCFRDIRLTDPSDDKARIEESKDGLLEKAYCWIMQNPEFQQWRKSNQSSILWIKGDAGKRKTMLICSIIDKLQKSSTSTAIMSYFFCQATDRRLDNATAVLRGLIFMLTRQQPSLVSYVQAEYDVAGKSLFEDMNARVALTRILRSMLADPRLHGAYMAIDALDECSADFGHLLQLIVTTSSNTSCLKWIVSSRNYPYIETELRRVTQAVRLSLELNETSIASAVKWYIDYKVSSLAKSKGYGKETQDAVRSNLMSNAHNTFLWVALANHIPQTLTDLVYDARRFLLYHKPVIERFPLQTYVSALLFSPDQSLMRERFAFQEPDNLTVTGAVRNEWSTCQQTLEGHTSAVNSVAFATDATRLASASDDSTVKI
ncbi:hypothetical protein LTR49_026232 [Elasticomyces elasticus]|nr:hypothetical protein LTR49_026232 [Elasticomyces elasticus]